MTRPVRHLTPPGLIKATRLPVDGAATVPGADGAPESGRRVLGGATGQGALPVAVTYQARIVSEANLRENRFAVAKRKRDHRGAATKALLAKLGGVQVSVKRTGGKRPKWIPQFDGWRRLGSPAALTVRMVRVAPRCLDDDNLGSGFKSTRDGIADWLGLDDRDKRVKFTPAQETGAAAEYAVRIELALGAMVTEST